MRKASICTILIVLGIFLFGALPAAAAPRYTWLDLNTVPGMTVTSTHPRSINQAGVVVGYADVPKANSPQSGEISTHAFFFNPGNPPKINDIPCPVPNAGVRAEWQGYYTNKKWWTGGRYKESSGPFNSHAFTYSPSSNGGNSPSSTNWDLGNLGGSGSWANGANDVGQVVGGSFTASGFQHAFLYSNGVMQDLLPGVISSEARAINNAGQVVGVRGGIAFLWSGGNLQDLGTLQAPYNATSYAYAINAIGQVVGSSSSSLGDSHAFLWKDNVMHDLGILPDGLICEAYGINDYGQVVGYSASSANGTRAFLYRGGVMLDLTSLVENLPAGEVLMIAYGINNRGQIIADGSRGHGYILTPIVSCPDCPSNGVITNATYSAGTTCSCSNATSISLGDHVTVENGATVTFKAPIITVQPGFHAQTGAVVNMQQ